MPILPFVIPAKAGIQDWEGMDAGLHRHDGRNIRRNRGFLPIETVKLTFPGCLEKPDFHRSLIVIVYGNQGRGSLIVAH